MFIGVLTQATVEEELRTLLSKLQKTIQDESIRQFTARLLPEGQPKTLDEVL